MHVAPAEAQGTSGTPSVQEQVIGVTSSAQGTGGTVSRYGMGSADAGRTTVRYDAGNVEATSGTAADAVTERERPAGSARGSCDELPPMVRLSVSDVDEFADGKAITLQWHLTDRVLMFELRVCRDATADVWRWYRMAMIERGRGGRMSCTLGNLETNGQRCFGLGVLDVNRRRSPFAIVHTWPAGGATTEHQAPCLTRRPFFWNAYHASSAP